MKALKEEECLDSLSMRVRALRTPTVAIGVSYHPVEADVSQISSRRGFPAQE